MRSIVVGVRAGDEPDPALDFALEEAVRRRLPLEAVHCVDGRGTDPQVEDALSNALARSAGRVPGGLTVAARALVQAGPAAECLVALASHAALLVVGRPDDAGPGRGPVTEEVLLRSWAPVAVIPHDLQPVSERWMRSRVMVAVDGSPASTSALLWGVAQAQEWDSVLLPVVVCTTAGRPPASLTRRTADLNAALWKLVREAGASGLEVHPCFLEGSPAQELLALVEPEDLLVLGSRSPGLSGLSKAVANQAQGPVVVIREGQSRRETHQRGKRTLLGVRS